jgi:hypothetical protein
MNLNEHTCICKQGCLPGKTQSSFSVYGDKTNYQLQNPQHKTMSKYIVDDCVLVNLSDDKKCDYLFVVEKEGKADGYFVELKGGNVPKAISQLSNSIEQLRANISGVLFGRIICSKFPKAPQIRQANAYVGLSKQLKGNLVIKTGKLSESV